MQSALVNKDIDEIEQVLSYARQNTMLLQLDRAWLQAVCRIERYEDGQDFLVIRKLLEHEIVYKRPDEMPLPEEECDPTARDHYIPFSFAPQSRNSMMQVLKQAANMQIETRQSEKRPYGGKINLSSTKEGQQSSNN